MTRLAEKKSELHLSQLTTALKNENWRLQKQAAKYQARNFSLQGKIRALEKELKKQSQKTDLRALIVEAQEGRTR